MRSLTLTLALASALAPLATPIWAQEVAANTAPAAPSLPAITVSTVTKRLMHDRIIASGLVAPQEEVQVISMVQGQQIAELLVDVGDQVTAGQVIARLSSSAVSLQVSELSAALDAARAAGDLQAADRLNAELAKASQDLSRAELTLKRTDIKSPVAGEISARNAELGALAGGAALPMFTIIRDGALELQADVSEADLLRLDVGQPVEMRLVNAEGPITGTVRLVEPTVNATTRLGRIRIAFDDSTQVRAGMFVEAAILVAQRETLAVPVTALGRYEGQSVAMAIVNGEAQRRPVKTGIREGGWLEITEGLAQGDMIVTKAGAFVRAGDKINPIPDTTQTN
jgi:HlyD family secretion protein